MRLRSAVLASLFTALLVVTLPGVANAAPRHNHGLTINVTPTHIISGEGVLIYGQLEGTTVSDQTIRLYHRINPNRAYTLVGTTTTDADGFYRFTRVEGVVLTNRSWFVRGPDHTHSRTVHVAVEALVSLAANNTNPDTLHPVTFYGEVFPLHRFQRVILQERTAGDDWSDLKIGFTGAFSNYSIVYRFKLPGIRELRVVFPGDRRNVRGASDPVVVTVQQAQNPFFTINTTSPVVTFPGSTTISGTLYDAGTTTPEAGQPVTLMARMPGQHQFVAVADATTGDAGTYSFTPQAPTDDTLYYVRITDKGSRHTALLWEGVRQDVTLLASTTSSSTGQKVTFTGTITPGNGADQVVYLQRFGRDGDWHTVAVALTNSASAYSIPWTLGDTGTDRFRTRVLSTQTNLGGASQPVSVTVGPAGSGALPPAS